MATIIINAITHRVACTDALGAADVSAYDGAIDAFFSKLAIAAKADGFGFQVDKHGQGPAAYRVTDESGPDDLQSAHEFMQSPSADFWQQF